MSDHYAAPQRPRRQTHRGFASLRSIAALMLREMATTYGRSPGGYIWAVIEPVAGIAVLSFGFSLLFKHPPIGSSFELFYATGLMPFTLFTTLSIRISQSFNFSRQLMAYPAVSFIDAILARVLVTMLTQLLVGLVVLTGILTLIETRSVPNAPLIVASYGLAMLLATSVGMVNAFLFARFPVWQVIWSVVTRPLFIVSGVLFLYGTMPRELQPVMWYNPLTHVIGIMRAGFYPTYQWDYVSVPYVCGVSLVLMLVGLRLLSWYHRDLLPN